MRTKILIASLGLGVAGALLPATAASASCIQVEGIDRCINPSCTVAGVANTALEAAGSDERLFCTL